MACITPCSVSDGLKRPKSASARSFDGRHVAEYSLGGIAPDARIEKVSQ